jgi:hypothetical protein
MKKQPRRRCFDFRNQEKKFYKILSILKTKKPYPDDTCEPLGEKGYLLQDEPFAKYHEQLNIPVNRMRKKRFRIWKISAFGFRT